MPVTLVIENVPVEVRDRLEAEAAREGTTLQDLLLERVCGEGRRRSNAAILDAHRAEMDAAGAGVDSETIVRTLRELRESR